MGLIVGQHGLSPSLDNGARAAGWHGRLQGICKTSHIMYAFVALIGLAMPLAMGCRKGIMYLDIATSCFCACCYGKLHC